MESAKFTITLRQARHADIPELRQLCVETIGAVCNEDYSAEQLAVWTSGVSNPDRWRTMIDTQYCVVAELEGKPVGIGSLEDGTYLDFLYVHKDYIRTGIATLLITELLNVASRAGAAQVDADVSKTARPFFERHGFRLLRENVKWIAGVEIRNFAMTRNLI